MTPSRRPALRAVLRRALPVATLLLAPAARAQQPSAAAGDAYVGTWQGALNVGGRSLRLGFVVRRDAAGALAGELVSIDQGMSRVPATYALRGDTLHAEVPAASITFDGVRGAPGDSLRGTFRQGPGALPLALGRVAALDSAPRAAAAPPSRPQDPKPPFPYRTEDVSVASVAGVRLAGTLTIPAGAGPFPAVVLVSGSGPQDRDEALMGHRPFAVIADHLARHGIASLRYDDRGTARSTGAHATATSADFADDAGAAVRWLRGRPEVRRVGIVGHSEGGAIGPMVAARSRDVDFLVLLAGPGIPGDTLLVLQGGLALRAAGVPEPQVAQAVRFNATAIRAVRTARDSTEAAARYDATVRATALAQSGGDTAAATAAVAAAAAGRAQLVSPWMRWFLAYDPAPTLRRVKVPVLALNGALDVQVPPAENLGAIGRALTAGGNRDHQEVTLPGLNHLFQTARTGAIQEYAQIPETFAPAALDAMTRWILQRFGTR